MENNTIGLESVMTGAGALIFILAFMFFVVAGTIAPFLGNNEPKKKKKKNEEKKEGD